MNKQFKACLVSELSSDELEDLIKKGKTQSYKGQDEACLNVVGFWRDSPFDWWTGCSRFTYISCKEMLELLENENG